MILWTFKKKAEKRAPLFCVFDQDSLYIGESFQDYSWIQDFEADFPEKVSLKMLN